MSFCRVFEELLLSEKNSNPNLDRLEIRQSKVPIKEELDLEKPKSSSKSISVARLPLLVPTSICVLFTGKKAPAVTLNLLACQGKSSGESCR